MGQQEKGQRDELPVGICALLEDLGADPEEVWDILEEEAE